MGIADKYFRETCKKIINEGISSEGRNVRARWEDGTPAHTKKIFGVVSRHHRRGMRCGVLVSA